MITSRKGTAERLLQEAMRLFAANGYAATSVGAIEEAAGLVPRRGGMYRHFTSKQALLETAVERHIADVSSAGDLAAFLAELPLEQQLRSMAELMLTMVEATREVSRVIEREGERIPALSARFRDGVVDEAVRQAAALVRTWVEIPPGEADALAVVLTGSLVNYRRTEWTFGSAPGMVPVDRFLDAWCASAALALAVHPPTKRD